MFSTLYHTCNNPLLASTVRHSPTRAIEALKRIDGLFSIERESNGLPPRQRREVRAERSRPLIAELEAWLREQRQKLSSKSETAKAINYSLNLWPAPTRFLDDGRLCISNNAAQRTLRCVAVGRHNWSWLGRRRANRDCKLNEIDPQACLADVLARLHDIPPIV